MPRTYKSHYTQISPLKSLPNKEVHLVIDPTHTLFVSKRFLIPHLSPPQICSLTSKLETLGNLNTLFLVRLVDYFVEEGSLVTVEEYCEGGEIGEYLQNQPPSKREVTMMNWLIQLGFGLKQLHLHNLVHNKLRMSSVLMTSNNTVKLGGLPMAFINTQQRLGERLGEEDCESLKEEDKKMLGGIVEQLVRRDWGDSEAVPSLSLMELNKVVSLVKREGWPAGQLLSQPFVRKTMKQFVQSQGCIHDRVQTKHKTQVPTAPNLWLYSPNPQIPEQIYSPSMCQSSLTPSLSHPHSSLDFSITSSLQSSPLQQVMRVGRSLVSDKEFTFTLNFIKEFKKASRTDKEIKYFLGKKYSRTHAQFLATLEQLIPLL